MRMYAFYIIRGHDPDKLANYDISTKTFLYYAWINYIEEENKKWGGE